MDEDTRIRAVEPFFTTKAVGEGTGLGLSMVHGLASQLGGAMTIISAPNTGTQIEVWLPISQQLAPDKLRMPDAKILHAEPGRVVLLVDDDDLVRTSIADMLEALGYGLIEASSAEEALKILAGGVQVDALITDHLMSGLNGTELARRVREQYKDIYVLVVSGYADAATFAPEIPHITKPFRIDDLAALLHKHLQSPDASGRLTC